MIKIKQIFNGLTRLKEVDPPTVPTGWNELTYSQLLAYEANRLLPTETDFQQVDQFYGLLEIMTGEPREVLESMPAGTDDYLAAQLGWLADSPDFTKLSPPKEIEYKGVSYEVPKNLELLTNKQMALIKIKFDQAVQDGKLNWMKAMEAFPFALSVVLDRLVFGSLDEERILSIEKDVREMPAILVYPIGSFFLNRWVQSMQSGTKRYKSRSKRRKSRRGLASWLSSGT